MAEDKASVHEPPCGDAHIAAVHSRARCSFRAQGPHLRVDQHIAVGAICYLESPAQRKKAYQKRRHVIADDLQGFLEGALMFKLFALCAATIAALTVGASAETLVERGSYLVNAVM